MATKSKRVLVTGSSGFTGKYLLNELSKQGFEIHELNGNSAADSMDIRNPTFVDEKIKQIDPSFVVHLAAISYVGHGSANEMYDVNILGTRNLFEAIQNHGKSVKKIIVSSSANVYGNSDKSFINENTAVRPANDYAISKVAVENLAAIYGEDLPIVVTRPFNYTGVGQSLKFLVPKLVDHFVRNRTDISLGNLEVSRDFSDVRTVSWAYVRLLEQGVEGQTYNIASGKARTLESIIEDLESLTAKRISVISDGQLSRKGEVLALRGDASKLWDTIGVPPEIKFRETLEWMLAESRLAN